MLTGTLDGCSEETMPDRELELEITIRASDVLLPRQLRQLQNRFAFAAMRSAKAFTLYIVDPERKTLSTEKDVAKQARSAA